MFHLLEWPPLEMVILNTACDLELASFLAVAPVDRVLAPCCSSASVSVSFCTTHCVRSGRAKAEKMCTALRGSGV